MDYNKYNIKLIEMKSIIKLITRYYRLEFYSIIMLIGFCMSSCDNDKADVLQFPLAVNSTAITLLPQGGSTYMSVYSTGSWNVSLPDSVDWAAIDKVKGKGNDVVLLRYSENLGEERVATLHLTSGEKAIDVVFTQTKAEDN
jgi:hypothetical protein